MKRRVGRRYGAGAAAVAMLGTALIIGTPASGATPSNAVPFGQSGANGYADGTELDLGALPNPTPPPANVLTVRQGISGATVNTNGLGTPLLDQLGNSVQPSLPSNNAFGSGTGLQVTAAGHSSAIGATTTNVAPPISQPQSTPTVAIGTPNSPTAALGPLLQAQVLTAQSAAIYSADQCPIGEPISRGFGNAAGVNAVNNSMLSGSTTKGVISTTGGSTSVAQSTSETYLTPNGDGSWGLSTSSTQVIAPVSINLAGQAIEVNVSSQPGGNNAVTLTAKTTGEAGGGSLTITPGVIAQVSIGGTNVVTLPISGGGTAPISTNLSETVGGLVNILSGISSGIPGVGTTLNHLLTVLNKVASVLPGATLPVQLSLGSITVGGPPVPTVNNGGLAQGGYANLVQLQLGLSGSVKLPSLPGIPATIKIPSVNVANLTIGHLEAVANTAAPIICNIPVIKVADPTSVTAGHSFTYTINVPNPAELQFLDCSLADMTVTDTIGDKPGSTSTFQVNSAQMEQANSSGQLVPLNVPATITQPDANHATVTWTGLNWNLGTPPLTGVINVTVPTSSPAGTIQDTVNATATLTGCQGITSISNTTLTGSYTLTQPGVTAVPPAQATTTVPGTATTKPPSLPFTGAIGGPWQPIGGLAALGLGAGAFALLRRTRRRIT